MRGWELCAPGDPQCSGVSSLFIGRSQGAPLARLPGPWAALTLCYGCWQGFCEFLRVDSGRPAQQQSWGCTSSGQELPHRTQNKVWWFLWVSFMGPQRRCM